MSKIPSGYRQFVGSHFEHAIGRRRIAPANPEETLKLTICVRARRGSSPLPDHAHWMATPPGKRKFLSVEELGAKHGAAQQDLDAVARFAEGHGLKVVECNVPVPKRARVRNGRAGEPRFCR